MPNINIELRGDILDKNILKFLVWAHKHIRHNVGLLPSFLQRVNCIICSWLIEAASVLVG